MVTRMEIIYRSKLPCAVKPSIFTTGGYAVNVGGHELQFDFEDMRASTEIESGHLYIYVLQQNFEDLSTLKADNPDEILRNARKEDFVEIYYECFEDADETHPIELEPLEITFTDFSHSVTGEPIIVGGDSFSGLEQNG